MNINSRKRELQEKDDGFLPTISKIFSIARFIGISNYGFTIAFVGSSSLFLTLLAIVVTAILKVIRLLTGIANTATGGRGLVGRLSGSIFYGNALLSLILSVRLVSSWTELSLTWLKANTATGLKLPPDIKIRKRVICVTTFVTTCACVEHVFSMMSATGFDIPPEEYFYRYIISSHGFLIYSCKCSFEYIAFYLKYIVNLCNSDDNIMDIHLVGLMTVLEGDSECEENPHISVTTKPTLITFKYEYTLWLAIPIFIVSKIATLLWNFQDLIIILISMGLASRYHRLNMYVNYLIRFEKRHRNVQMLGTDIYIQVQVWRRLREAYVRQAALVRQVNIKLGALILLSNANNLYFICLQLFLGIGQERGSLINRAYYFLSLGWLVFRACSVVLATSDVHVHSKRVLPTLYACPGSGYNIEIKRLINQLANDDVSLTGLGLFSLNRNLLLQVAAAILKYELVLIQYDYN